MNDYEIDEVNIPWYFNDILMNNDMLSAQELVEQFEKEEGE
jgi:hypothetical protein